jgi:ubiquinone/menaquinone biosynthesis C-methylase UbiE
MALKTPNDINQTDLLSPNQPNAMSELAFNSNQFVRGLLDRKTTADKVTHSNDLGEYEDESVQRTLDPDYVTKPILEARNIQNEILAKRFKGKKIRIADIGCGDGNHGETFAPDCDLYHGFEIAKEMVNETNQRWSEKGLKNAKVVECDAANVELQPNYYDVAWSLYFTSGNFRDPFDDLAKYTDAYLDKNPKFIAIILNFCRALKPGGKMFLTVYKDKPETEATQRKFYEQTGQTVITPWGSRFVATNKNFWSVRWTKESMLSNLAECGIKPEQVKFNDLNEIGWLVEITKPEAEEECRIAA